MDRLITVRPMLTIDERLAEQMGPQRLGAAVMGGLGFVAALLAALGSYVVAETTAVLRRREMGIRAALGARGTQLARMVLLQTGRLVGAGLVLGLGVAWLGTGTIRALLFRTAPLDPLILGGVAGLILLVSLAVSLKPALRTARVDLAGVLREE
jgi:ABC-type antimicrobial peptide transport system permease subunit